MPHPAQQIRFCKSRDGTRIAYATCGSGPPLVWIQQWVHHLDLDWNSSIWRPWLTLLTKRHTVIRYDWRGCGLSDRDAPEFSADRHADDLDAVIDAAGIDRFPIFAMAGGGCGIAMMHAAKHPDRVERLILFGPHLHGRLARSPATDKVEESSARLKVFELGWTTDNPAYGQFFTAIHIPGGNANQTAAYNSLLRRTAGPKTVQNLLRSFWHGEFEDYIPQVKCPTLVLHSRGDCVIPFDDGRKVAAMLPNAHFVSLESRNHVMLETDADWLQMMAAVDEFLPRAAPVAAELPFGDLTAREREILEAVAQGLENPVIAARLKISEKTVRNHVSTTFSKLGVTSRSQAIVRAREAGFGLSAPSSERKESISGVSSSSGRST